MLFLIAVAAGREFSIVAVSEGAMRQEDAAEYDELVNGKENAQKKGDKEKANTRLLEFQTNQMGKTMRLAQELETLTGLESRITILGYVQRGGIPSAMDRLLATELGSAAVDLISNDVSGVMIALRNQETLPVPLKDVVDKRRMLPLDHIWLKTARA